MIKIGKQINKSYYRRDKLVTGCSYLSTERDKINCRVWDVQYCNGSAYRQKNYELNLPITYICKSI